MTDDVEPPIYDIRIPRAFWVIGAGQGRGWTPREDLPISLSESSAIHYAHDLTRMSEVYHEARRFAV